MAMTQRELRSKLLELAERNPRTLEERMDLVRELQALNTEASSDLDRMLETETVFAGHIELGLES